MLHEELKNKIQLSLELSEEYYYDPKIPTVQQFETEDENKKKNLNTVQTNESRLVTKVRYIIEKQIGVIKANKSLDNIRNTIAGHIAIDYPDQIPRSNSYRQLFF